MLRQCALLGLLTMALPAVAIDDYKLGPDSIPQVGVPKGKVIKQEAFHSKVFPETVRDWWIYVPAQYDGSQPACVMVFQDGQSYVNEKGQYRVPVVFDNLIHRKEMPVTIGIFINPGVIPAKAGQAERRNRSFEYDSLSDQYVRMLADEILPLVSKQYKLRQDAAGRAICGASSGGICAFTAAWERPDLFSKVLSHIGSFTNIRGGDVYPGKIRKTARKPIKVFLQDGSSDLDNEHGNWPLANQQMAKALQFAGYEYQFVYGDGAHNGKHGGSILPESLRWLWSDTSPKTDLLWPKGAPGAAGDEDRDKPSITVYRPSPDVANGCAVIVCPGGGYGALAMDHEGKQPAEFLTKLGVTAFVLKYRLAPRYHHPAPLDDAQRAVRLVRSRAGEWKIDPNRIGVWGFSAGGHLASSVGTHYDAGNPAASDPVDRASCRPDFLILAYPVISMEQGVTHAGSRRNLLGDAPAAPMVQMFCNDKMVNAKTPPTFLFHTSEDKAVLPENSLLFYRALAKAGVPAELHIYEKGPHGVGLAPKDPVLSSWPGRLATWLERRGLLRKPA